MDIRERQTPSEGGDNLPQQDDLSSELIEVAQGQRRRRLTEDTESQERERKCSRVGLLSSSLLQGLAPVQDWGKGVRKEANPGGVEVEAERENGCGAKEGRICEKDNVDLGKPRRGGLEERNDDGQEAKQVGEWVEVLIRKGKGRGKGMSGRKGSI
ncbi:hypothetical protein ABG768_016072 [Culter alburnus]|uniref:Uncharacterized protein n=1 Tax=Culter alburnus TaxID=194366 RepID=A0AAW1YXQ3_CULAL